MQHERSDLNCYSGLTRHSALCLLDLLYIKFNGPRNWCFTDYCQSPSFIASLPYRQPDPAEPPSSPYRGLSSPPSSSSSLLSISVSASGLVCDGSWETLFVRSTSGIGLVYNNRGGHSSLPTGHKQPPSWSCRSLCLESALTESS
jgi:hypothetical protein